jgi:hypothetical protein
MKIIKNVRIGVRVDGKYCGTALNGGVCDRIYSNLDETVFACGLCNNTMLNFLESEKKVERCPQCLKVFGNGK